MDNAGTFHARRNPASPEPFGARFVGRAQELARLDSMLDATQSGQGGVALLVGEAGIGKTRTAEEAAERARRRGIRVAWGRCWEGEECPAFGPWSEVLRGLVGTERDSDLRDRFGERAKDLAVLLPAVGRTTEATAEARAQGAVTGGAARLTTGEGAQRLIDSLSSLLRSATKARPVFVILDNLNLADDSSLRFLRHFAPEIPTRLFILGTCRPTGETVTESLLLTMRELAKSRSFLQMELKGLTRGEVRTLVAGGVGSSLEIADRIHERTEGNPLFVGELLRQILADPGAVADGPLPEGIRQVIRARLRRLSLDCQRMLATASVLGRGFAVETLSEILDRNEAARVLDLLSEAEAAAVLQAVEPGLSTFRFSHALVQEALLENMTAPERSRLHERAATAMERLELEGGASQTVDILHHLVRAGSIVEPHRLVDRACRAADEAAELYAPDQSLRIIEEALAAWGRLGRSTDVRIAPLLHRRGTILADLFRPLESRESLVQAFDIYEAAGDRQRALEVALTPAWESPDDTTWLTRGTGRGLRVLRARAEKYVQEGTAAHLRFLLQRGSRADLKEVVESARRIGEPRFEAMALAELAYHELLAWELEAAEGWLAEAEVAAAAVGDFQLVELCGYTRYCLSLITGRAEGATAAVRDLLQRARSSRSMPALAEALYCAAFLASKRGDWGEARRSAHECISLPLSSNAVFCRVMSWNTLIDVELQIGRFSAARERMKEASAAGAWTAPVDPRATVLGARFTGDGTMLPAAPQRFDLPSADESLITFVPGGLLYAAPVAAIRGDRQAASFSLTGLRRWSGTFWEDSTDALLGRLCSVLGRLDEAVKHFDNAIVFCRRAGYLPAEAWALSDLAKLLERRGLPADRERRAELLEEALAICRKLGMSPLSRQILGGREGRSGPQGRGQSDVLSSREIEVLRLVSHGLSNPEIARKLSLSPLTVARHVHNLLDKTGMANRAEVTAWAGRRGLLDDDGPSAGGGR